MGRMWTLTWQRRRVEPRHTLTQTIQELSTTPILLPTQDTLILLNATLRLPVGHLDSPLMHLCQGLLRTTLCLSRVTRQESLLVIRQGGSLPWATMLPVTYHRTWWSIFGKGRSRDGTSNYGACIERDGEAWKIRSSAHS